MTGHDEAGQIAGIEGVVFGMLVFVLGTLVVTNAWGIIDSKWAAGSAAREGTRAFVESEGPSVAEAMAEAEVAARDAISGLGRDPRRMVFEPEEARFERCGRVVVRIEYPVPLVAVPLIGRYGRGFTAVGRHSEMVDPFRSGLPDRGACPQLVSR